MVVWMQGAQQDLAAIWMAATDRNAVTRASHQIDLALATSPNTVGDSVFDTVREYTCLPLGIEFEVIDADMRVFVLTVWDTSIGRPGSTGN
jgi:hypothetical protein